MAETMPFCNVSAGRTDQTPKKRLVSKDGDIMFEVRNVNERWRFVVDLFTSLIVLKWRWVLLIFCASYVLSWLVFGCLWALLVVAYGPGHCVDQVRYQRFEVLREKYSRNVCV